MGQDALRGYLVLLNNLMPGEKVPKKYFELHRWLMSVKPSTRRSYVAAMRRYQFFTGLTPKQMIDEAEEDHSRPVRKRGAVENRLIDFHNYLINDYVRKDRHGKKTNIKHIGGYSAVKKIGCIKSFYSTHGFKYKWSPPKAAPKKTEREDRAFTEKCYGPGQCL